MIKIDVSGGMFTAVRTNGAALQAFCLRQYSEVANHLLNNYASGGAITNADATILKYTQLDVIMLWKGEKALYATATSI